MVQRPSPGSFMRPAARRALKLALRMHSAAFHPSATMDSAASHWLAAGTSSSSALAKTAMPHLGKSGTAAAAQELRKLPIRRLQRVCFSSRSARGLCGQYLVLNAASVMYQLHLRGCVAVPCTRMLTLCSSNGYILILLADFTVHVCTEPGSLRMPVCCISGAIATAVELHICVQNAGDARRELSSWSG